MKIGYLLFNDVLWKPLIRRQVVDLLIDIQKNNNNIQVNLITAYPWYTYIVHNHKIRRIAKELQAYAIKVHLVLLPFPAPIPFFWPRYIRGKGLRPRKAVNSFSQKYLELMLFPVWLRFYYFHRIKIFHCRSYPVSGALQLFKRFFPDAAFIFDPRSDFPEENQMLGSASFSPREFNFWKRKEALLLRNADATICITDYYQSHYQKNFPQLKAQIIPNNVDTNLFRFSETFRNTIRQREGIEAKTVFCYLGTMYPNSWHRPSVYATFIKSLRSTPTEAVVLFLVPGDCRRFVEEELAGADIKPHEYLIRHPEYEEVPAYLSASDFGLFFMPRQKIALSVKVVEYQATGLPVLVNENAISAAIYIKENNAGMIVNLATGDLDIEATDLSAIDFTKVIEGFSRERIAALAHQNFSNQHVARQYALLYKKLGESAQATEIHPSV